MPPPSFAPTADSTYAETAAGPQAQQASEVQRLAEAQRLYMSTACRNPTKSQLCEAPALQVVQTYAAGGKFVQRLMSCRQRKHMVAFLPAETSANCRWTMRLFSHLGSLLHSHHAWDCCRQIAGSIPDGSLSGAGSQVWTVR